MDEEKKSEASCEEPERLGPYVLQELPQRGAPGSGQQGADKGEDAARRLG